MKKTIHSFAAASFAVALLCIPTPSRAQNIYVANNGANSVNEYNAVTGAAVVGFTPISLASPYNLALTGNVLIISNGNSLYEYNATTGAAINTYTAPSGLSDPEGMAVSGNNIYVVNSYSGVLGEYSLSTGAAVGGFTSNPGRYSQDVVLSGNTLYVSNTTGGGFGQNTVFAFNATTGAAVGGFVDITGLNSPYGLAVSADGTKLFVENNSGTTVGEYNAATGAAIQASFITGLSNPQGLSLLGNTLFVTNGGNNTVEEFNATTGAALSGSTSPTGLSSPFGIVATPEPTVWISMVGGLGMLAGFRRKRAA